MLAESLKSKAPVQKPKPAALKPAAAPHVETELERVQRHFEFLRQHGGLMAEGRYDRNTGQVEWRRRW